MEGMIRRMKVNAVLLVVLVIGIFICYGFRDQVETTKYELPKIQSTQPEKIVHHSGYSVSFNTDWLIPNWVAYELTAEEVQERHQNNSHHPWDFYNNDARIK